MDQLWTILNNPAVIGLIVAIPSFLVGYLGYRRSLKLDSVAQQAGSTTFHLGAVDQIIDGLNDVIKQLREDKKELRDALKDLRGKLREAENEVEGLNKWIETLKNKLGVKLE